MKMEGAVSSPIVMNDKSPYEMANAKTALIIREPKNTQETPDKRPNGAPPMFAHQNKNL